MLGQRVDSIMTLPSIFFGLLIASIFGLVFHLIRGGRLPRLFLYLLTAWVTFFAGHIVGEWLDWHLARIGPLNIFSSSLGNGSGLDYSKHICRSRIDSSEKTKLSFFDIATNFKLGSRV